MRTKIVALLLAIVAATAIGGVFASGVLNHTNTPTTTTPMPVTITEYYVRDANADTYTVTGLSYIICDTDTARCAIPPATLASINATALLAEFPDGQPNTTSAGFHAVNITCTLTGTLTGNSFTFQHGYSYTLGFLTSQNTASVWTYAP